MVFSRDIRSYLLGDVSLDGVDPNMVYALNIVLLTSLCISLRWICNFRS